MSFAFISEIILILISLLKGSKQITSIVNIEVCSVLFWLIEFTYFPITILLVYIIANNIKKEYNYRKSINYRFLPSDIQWNNKNIVKYSFIGIITGILSGTLGIGGGSILVPLLLTFGIQPFIATSTSLMVVLFECISVSFQSLFLGNLNFDYLIICPIMSSFGGFLGTSLSRAYIARTNKPYMFVGVVAICLLITCMIYTYKFTILFTGYIIKGALS